MRGEAVQDLPVDVHAHPGGDGVNENVTVQRDTAEFKFNVQLLFVATHAKLVAFWILHNGPNKSRCLMTAEFSGTQHPEALH